MRRLTAALLATSIIVAVPASGQIITGGHNAATLAVLATTTPASPSATSSTGAFKMMGLGANCFITPSSSGVVILNIQGSVKNTNAGDGYNLQLAYGTVGGGAPSNGATATGTVVGSELSGLASTVPFSLTVVVTGLSVGVAYYWDAQLESVTANSAQILSVTCSGAEI